MGYSYSSANICVIYMSPFQQFSCTSFSGFVVYNETDNDGHCFIGYCSENCQVVPKDYPCPKPGKECALNPPRLVCLHLT